MAFCAGRNQFLIKLLVSFYWSGFKAADRTLLVDFGGRRRGRASFLCRTKPISDNPFGFKVSRRFFKWWMGSLQGLLGGRRFCGFVQGHVGCSQSQESMGRGGGGHTKRASCSGIGGNFGGVTRDRQASDSETSGACRQVTLAGRAFGSSGRYRLARGLKPGLSFRIAVPFSPPAGGSVVQSLEQSAAQKPAALGRGASEAFVRHARPPYHRTMSSVGNAARPWTAHEAPPPRPYTSRAVPLPLPPRTWTRAASRPEPCWRNATG